MASSPWQTTPPLSQLISAIASPSNPIGMRMRAAYFLRQEYERALSSPTTVAVLNNDKSKEDVKEDSYDGVCRAVIECLGEGLKDRDHGSLMRHEFAYVMGQLRDERCCSVLENILTDETDNTMVRHEAAEALGAIGAPTSIPVLESTMMKAKEDEKEEIGQTCEIAVDYMKWKSQQKENEEAEYDGPACACMLSPYSSVDPAPPHPTHVNLSTSTLGAILRDVSKPLFERYRAMFSLRNRGTEECVLELGQTLISDKSSALLRHEIAYVLGQMAHPSSLECLSESLRRDEEHEMVRHESAEALGAIEGRWDDVERVLREFVDDDDVVVKESCLVALDAADYWGYGGGSCDEEGEKEEAVGNNNDEDDEKKVDSDKATQPLSFVQQKAVTNGKRNEEEQVKMRDTIRNHFNVVGS